MSFEYATGSVPGRDHIGTGRLLVGKNNQDASCIRQEKETLIAVVCDGCSASSQSEIGAQIGARMIADRVWHIVAGPLQFGLLQSDMTCERPELLEIALERVRQDVLAQLRVLASQLGSSLTQAIKDYFLFTVLGVIVTPKRTVLFSLGDGVFAINGEFQQLGPFAKNAPPYLGYAMEEGFSYFQTDQLKFQVQRSMPTSQLDSLLIGSDGVKDWMKAEGEFFPWKTEQIPTLESLWKEKFYYQNPDALRRKLALMNSESVRVDRETNRTIRSPGLLPDDTTVVVIRRKQMKPASADTFLATT